MKPRASDSPIMRSIALIGDLHFGSIYAVAKQFVTHDGRSITPSLEQMYLNEVFQWCKDKMEYWNCDTVIFLGDLIQGLNVKDLGRDLVTSDLEEQKRMAIEYLTPICKGKKVYGISGTKYHKSKDTEIEKIIIEQLKGKFLDSMAWLKIKNSKRVLNVSHASSTGTIYPLSGCEREASQMLKAYGEGKLPHKPDIIIRGHRHVFGHIHASSYHFILTPAFQAWSPWSTKYYGAVQPDIGIVMLFIDKKDRCIVHHYTKPSRQIGDKTFEI